MFLSGGYTNTGDGGRELILWDMLWETLMIMHGAYKYLAITSEIECISLQYSFYDIDIYFFEPIPNSGNLIIY